MTGISAPRIDDTIAAVSSAAGPGARAIVRVSGPDTLRIITTVFTPNELLRNRYIAPGQLRLTDLYSPLPAYLLFRKSPHTYTGPDLGELHLVSSPPLVERLMADLLAAGARSAGPGEFTMRAFLAGKKNLPQAEAVLAVIHAGSDAELTSALRQLAGGLTRPLDRLRDDLLNLLADLEAGLDFADEDITFVSLADIRRRMTDGIDQLTQVRQQLDDRSVSGQPWRVALAGLPNAGKSQLFNALIGRDTAIVSPIAGTTRDYLTHLDRDANIEFVDTAGWDDATNTIEEQAQALGREQTHRADLVLHCLPVDAESVTPFPLASIDVLTVRTKADLRPTRYAVSALTGEGIGALKRLIIDRRNASARPALAPSLSRCRHHVDAAIASLTRGRDQTAAEMIALELRSALREIGEMTGTIVTNDLLDRVFSRFCIGK